MKSRTEGKGEVTKSNREREKTERERNWKRESEKKATKMREETKTGSFGKENGQTTNRDTEKIGGITKINRINLSLEPLKMKLVLFAQVMLKRITRIFVVFLCVLCVGFFSTRSVQV